MLYILALCILLSSIIFGHRKIQSYIILVFLWLLFAFSYGNADYDIHLRRYTQYQVLNSQTEWLYNKLMLIFNHFGFSYQEFLIILSAFVLLVFFIFVKKHTKNVAGVLALYMIYPFCMDVTMVRYTLAISIVYIGLDHLFESKKWWGAKYIACVLIASLIHLSAVVCLIFLLPKFVDLKKLSKLMILLTIGITAFSSLLTVFVDKLASISFLNIGTKLSIVLNAANLKYNFSNVMVYMSKMLLILICTLIIYYIQYRWIKRNKVFENNKENEEINFFNLALGMNITIFPLIGLLGFSVDLFRIQLSLSLVNYVAFAQYFDIRDKLNLRKETYKISITTCEIVVGTVFIALIGLYLWVLSSTNFSSVFRALFENNILLQ